MKTRRTVDSTLYKLIYLVCISSETENNFTAGSTVKTGCETGLSTVKTGFFNSNFRYGPFPMMYWPWDLIGENMQLCLAGLRDVDRLVEIYTYDAFAQHLMKHQNAIRARQVVFIRSQCC